MVTATLLVGELGWQDQCACQDLMEMPESRNLCFAFFKVSFLESAMLVEATIQGAK